MPVALSGEPLTKSTIKLSSAEVLMERLANCEWGGPGGGVTVTKICAHGLADRHDIDVVVAVVTRELMDRRAEDVFLRS